MLPTSGSARRARDRFVVVAIVMGLLLIAGACDDSQQPAVDCVNGCDPAAVVSEVVRAYASRDEAILAAVLHPGFVFESYPLLDPATPQGWDRDSEVRLHQRMFHPASVVAPDPPVYPNHWLQSATVELVARSAFVERPEFYRSIANPEGLDPMEWKALGAVHATTAVFHALANSAYAIHGSVDLVVVQDLTRVPGAAGSWQLYRWRDLGPVVAGRGGVMDVTWSQFKRFYQLGDCERHACSPEAVVTRLRDLYAVRAWEPYPALLHEGFLFLAQPDPLDPERPAAWGRTEELRIHKRMFSPQSVPPSDPPVDPDLWLAAIDIALGGAGPFEERPEFYRSAANPDGLDEARWKVVAGDYHYSVLFQTQGETDYQAIGRSWFAIAQDRTAVPGEPGSFRLYRWQDLGSYSGAAAGQSPSTWTSVKWLYSN